MCQMVDTVCVKFHLAAEDAAAFSFASLWIALWRPQSSLKQPCTRREREQSTPTHRPEQSEIDVNAMLSQGNGVCPRLGLIRLAGWDDVQNQVVLAAARLRKHKI